MNELLNNVGKVVFGLEAQGHILTIEAYIAKFDKYVKDGEKNNMMYSSHVWEDIGRIIGWCPLTAALSYFEYLNEKK